MKSMALLNIYLFLYEIMISLALARSSLHDDAEGIPNQTLQCHIFWALSYLCFLYVKEYMRNICILVKIDHQLYHKDLVITLKGMVIIYRGWG